MIEPFIGSEAVAGGALAKSVLRSRCRRLFPDVYTTRDADLDPILLGKAAWLWSGRAGIVAGRSAAAIHGADWVAADAPVDLIHGNRSAPPGIRVRGDRIDDGEFMTVDGTAVTTPARTALDLACWYRLGQAVAELDSLARVTGVEISAVESRAYRCAGRRGIRSARRALSLVDPGSQSPKETWLRLMLIDAGLPVPQTQIPVRDDVGHLIGYLDMGWQNIMVAVEYDGEQHRTDRRQYTWDLRRLERLESIGWIVVRVVAGDRREDILRRVRAAVARRVPPRSDGRCSA